MTPEEERRIQKFNDELDRDVQIGLLTTEDRRSNKFGEFCENLTRCAPKIRIVQEDGEPEETPSMRIGQGLRYHAIPLGTELEPFLEALAILDRKPSEIPMSIRDRLEKVHLPAVLQLYVSQQCPYCPVTTRQVTPLPAASESIQLSVIDCTLFPEMAESHRIQSVPTLLLDDQFRWTGLLRLEELVEMMTGRDPCKLSPSSLERMLKEGNAAQLAEMMLDNDTIFPAFLDLLTHEKWPVRLGAMVAMEEIADRNPELATRVIDPLWERFQHVGDTVKGDILYVLGEAGDDAIAPRLKTISNGQYPREVKEAAEEALEKLTKE